MATEFYSYYNIPSTLPEFDWKKTTSVRTNWSIGNASEGKYGYGTVLQKKANSVSGLTRHGKYKSIPWNDVEALKRYVLRTGVITEASAEEADINLDDLESLHGIIGVILSGNTNKKYSMADSGSNLGKLKNVQGYADKLDEVVTALQGKKGASDANIIDILNSKNFEDADDITVFAKGIESLPDNIGDALESTTQKAALEELDIWGEISAAISATDSQSGSTWGGTASEEGGDGTPVGGGVPLNNKPTKSTTQVVEGAVNEIIEGTPRTDVTKTLKDQFTIENVKGRAYLADPNQPAIEGQSLVITRDPDNPDSYSIASANDPNVVYRRGLDEDTLNQILSDIETDTDTSEFYDYTDPEGNQLDYVNGQYQYPDGTPYTEGGMSDKINKAEESAGAAQDVVDEAVQDVAAGADTAADIQTSVTGGDVSTGVAEQLGWEKGTKEVDGKTVTTFTDPRTDITYDVDPDTGMLTDTDGNTVSTVGTMNFEENDFAQQFTDAANDFLYGSVISEQAAQSLGFTKTDKGYTGPDGVEYTVNEDGNLVNIDNEVVRSDGFLAYQTQLTNANSEYVSRMEGADGQGGLLAEYDKAYTDYEGELRPRLDQLDSNTAALNQVAQDANSPDYYNRLSNLYYEQSRDEINRSSRGAQETLQSTYANAGMDPSSPAYTSAIMDLQNKRSDAMVSARRQAILDSYSVGSNMLGNRTSALTSAQTGIRYGMDALSDLYDVKLEGLGVERDMISTIYEGKKEGAKLGMEGLGVTAGIERDKISADQTQFYKDIDLVTGLNKNTVDTNVTAANTAGAADANATDDYWTGIGWLQGLIDNNVDMKLFGTALQTQFADDPDALNFLTPEQKQMLGIGT